MVIFERSILRGANSSGDSGSIACIAGSIAGAMNGIGGVPADWVSGVEKPEILKGLSMALHGAAGRRSTFSALDQRVLDVSFGVFGAGGGKRSGVLNAQPRFAKPNVQEDARRAAKAPLFRQAGALHVDHGWRARLLLR